MFFITLLLLHQFHVMATPSSSSSKINIDDAIDWLAVQRKYSDRQSAKVVEYGELVIENCNIAKKLGDEQWSFLEQVALASLDVGNLDLAGLCIARLDTRFPDSARATALQGMLLEARGEYEKAFNLYDMLLSKDASNQIIVKRLVSVLKCMDQKDGISGIAAAIQSLNKYLDTYYNDAEAWQELASLYLSQNLYSQAAFALEELILLAPSNTFFVLQYAEVLATMDDLPLAYKQYLRVLEMCGTESLKPDPQHPHRQGPWLRSLWGLKSVTTKLLQRQRQTISSTTKGASNKGFGISKLASSIDDEKAEKVEAIDAMVTDLLLNKAYTGADPGLKATRDAARKVLSAT